MLEQLMQTAVQYIDTAMVGSLGTQATAAVGATSTINWLLSSTISALGVGFLAYISQACGSGDKEKAARASSQAVMVTLLVGSLFTVLALSLSGLVPVWMQVDPEIRELTGRYFFILYSPMLLRAATIIFGTMLRAVGDTRTPTWEYSPVSNLRDTMVDIYTAQYGKAPTVKLLHAGLECGLLMQKLPGLDAISFGPNVKDGHSTRERLDIQSTLRTWNLLLAALKAL